MSALIDHKCPSCSRQIELEVFRWDSVAVCPACYQHLAIEFDFYVGEDEDEYDFYEVSCITSDEFFKRQGVYGGIGAPLSESRLRP